MDTDEVRMLTIKKGYNRNPHADLIHKWAEGIPIEMYTVHDGWVDYIPFVFHESYIFRVKNKEDVFEYQYYITNTFSTSLNSMPKLSSFITDKEFNTCTKSKNESWVKILESKRKRE